MEGPLGGPLNSHLGAAVSALVDGQLDEESTDEAWAHVHQCPPCRRLVEREGWVKRRLGQMAGSEPSATLLGSLYELDPSDEAVDAWVAVGDIERQGRGRRRLGIAMVGAGSVGAAVFGLSALSGAPLLGPASNPAASLSRGAGPSAPVSAFVAPLASAHGRLPGWTVRRGDPGVRSAASEQQH